MGKPHIFCDVTVTTETSTMKKAMTLVNINAPYELKPSTMILASQHRTSTILQLLVYKEEILIRDLLKDKEDPEYERKVPVSEASFDEIMNLTHTLILPDSMLCERSRVFETEAFYQNALEPIRRFYKEQQGTVLIQCVEGAFGTNIKINKLFDLDWKIHVLDTKTVTATEIGKDMLGPFTPKHIELKELPFFVECTANEGLYSVPLMDRQQFDKDFRDQDEAFERLGIEKDESLTCFNIDKSWENYLEKYTNRFLIAVHRGESSSEGHIVWYGDRGNSETLAYVFCKMLHLEKGDDDNMASASGVATKSGQSQSTGFWLPLGVPLPLVIAALVVLVAIFIQMNAK